MSHLALTALALLVLLSWCWMLLARGGYWLARPSLDEEEPEEPSVWPEVVALVPARDEAETIGPCLRSLLSQDYPGRLSVVVIDDHSSDETGRIAAEAAETAGARDRVSVTRPPPLPTGWAGKLWALEQGRELARGMTPDAAWVWLTDADIAHGRGQLRRLVAKGESEDLDLVSLMVRLALRSPWEKLLIPPFVLFFQKLFPFAWVASPERNTAAAAGGCVLVRRGALDSAGGFRVIRDAVIDDCALAARIKSIARARGRGIWLGLTRRSESLRGYPGLAGIWRMVKRSAFTQLDYSAMKLAGAVAGMAFSYLLAPLLVLTAPLHGSGSVLVLALAAWALIAASLAPTLAYYRQPLWLAPLLPLSAALYTAMTVDSALAYWRGKGGQWKGRIQARA